MKKSILNLTLVAAGLFLACFISGAQTFRVTGKVTDAANGEAVIGATVMVKGTSRGVSADAGGPIR